MPSAADLLAQLTRAAHEALAVAALWHLLVGAVVVLFVLGWRPTQRLGLWLAAAPLGSVAIVSVWVGNPFNAATFAALATTLLLLARHAPLESLERSSTPVVAVGACMIAFGWFYPHFLDDSSLVTYAWGAPVGVVPCATLYVVLGFALLVRGFSHRTAAIVVAAAGLLYGTIGVVVLRVAIDVGLIFGALLLAAVAPRSHLTPTLRAHST